jgi:beta-lactam-binding protein with PASTA domain/tRNA A-37 threonylcarbamoyl transferase component Bud32
MTGPDPLIGTLFDGRYQILKRLGSGGMATVYLAEDQELGRQVAIKILNTKHASDEQFVERFRREASSAASLNHPNIVAIYDRGEAEGTYYIAMEVIQGRSLKELLLTRGASPVSVAIAYTRQILAALRFAHRHGIVHRDIKPHNIIVDDEGRVKVTDFGIAHAGTSQMTEVGSIIGTAQYLSPEQARGTPVDARSDLYSVGIVLYELLTGDVPFSGDTPVEIAMRHLSTIPEPPSGKRPEVSSELDAVVLRALAKDPDDRYQSADEMDADLARIAIGLGVSEETAEAATAVLAGAGLAAPTLIGRAPTHPTASLPPRTPTRIIPGPGYYDVPPTPPPRQRTIWPWLIVLALLIAAGIGSYIVYQQIRQSTGETQAVEIPYVVGLRQRLAIRQITKAGLTPKIVGSQPSQTQKRGFVTRQSPEAGNRDLSGNTVQIWISSGKPKIKIPADVVGMKAIDAVQALTNLGLRATTKNVNSDKPTQTVIGTKPSPGTAVTQGGDVVILVSKGPKPVPLPDVRGQSYDHAISVLQANGFTKVQRSDVQSGEPVGTVISELPPQGTMLTPEATVTLVVSKGPGKIDVPDVVNLALVDAETTLQQHQLSVGSVTYRPTSDQTQDNLVVQQHPSAGAQVPPGTAVRLVVFQYVSVPTTTTTPTIETTTTGTTTVDTTTTTG